jgi:DNA-binding MarR family transcriptional regulator
MTTKNKDIKPAACNCLNLRRASMAITELYDKYLSPCGITISQFSLLKYIGQLGPINVSDLAVAVRLDRTTLVRNLKPLEEKGFIIDTSIKGTRNRQLELSEMGREALHNAIPQWEKAQGRIEICLGKEELTVLTKLLNKIERINL